MSGLIRGENIHFPRTALLCLENTQNRCSGAVLPQEHIAELAGVAHARGVRVHIDGARIFNAAVALDIPVADLVRDADSMGFCLSKGLGAPVGSVLCGDATFIARARKMRKMLGGGMRQAGSSPQPGSTRSVHGRPPARRPRQRAGARAQPRRSADDPPRSGNDHSNIVIFHVRGDWQDFARALRRNGVLASVYGERRMRWPLTTASIAQTSIAPRDLRWGSSNRHQSRGSRFRSDRARSQTMRASHVGAWCMRCCSICRSSAWKIASARRAPSSGGARCGSPEAIRDEIVTETLAIANDPKFAPLFAEGSLAEVPVVAVLRGEPEAVALSGQIHRLAVLGDELLTSTTNPTGRRRAEAMALTDVTALAPRSVPSLSGR